jgi:hypothetical protein
MSESRRLGGLGTGYCGEHLDLRERKKQEAEEQCIMKSFIIFTPHQTLLK